MYLGYLALWLLYRFFSWSPSEVWLDRLHRSNAKRFLRLALSLRGGLIKVGQFISTRADVMPKPWLEELAALQDRVPASPWPVIRAELEAEYGRAPEAVFAEISKEAVAAASFGQVHRVRTHAGEDIALKIRYADIADKLAVDLLILRIAVPLFNIFIPKIRLDAIYDEMRTVLNAELDYRLEAEYGARIRENLRTLPRVHVPRVIAEYSTDNVIATEFFEGYKVTDRRELAALQVNPRELLDLVLSAWAKMIYEDGIFQSDPHPGNLLFRVKEGRLELCILDFGQVKVLPAGFQDALFRTVAAFLSKNAGGVANGLVELGMLRAEDGPKVEPFVQGFFERYMHLSPAEARAIDVDQVRREARELLKRIDGITIPSDVVMHGRTLELLAGIASHLDESENLFVLAKPHLMKLFMKYSLRQATAGRPASPAGNSGPAPAGSAPAGSSAGAMAAGGTAEETPGALKIGGSARLELGF
jgi:predicted unusual protein kinase regulating ubiquinone biosynthesis (AarF/ABC1/UbiB family)